MIKNDIWLRQHGPAIFSPFASEQVRTVLALDGLRQVKAISYGVTSYGYDLRLSPKDFKTFRHIPGTILDPKNFNPENLTVERLYDDASGKYFILPAHSYGLGVALERMVVPADVITIAIGKSTYARAGIIVNTTPAEPGWEGHLTLEFSNSSDTDCKIYANEGVTQLLLLQGEPCEVSYAARSGKYQYQAEEVVLAKV